MTKRRVIIHIGPHKTGTTSIQNVLYTLSLKDGSNFIYPFTRPDQTGQHEFAQLASNPEHPEFARKLAILASVNRTCVLSSEEFCYLSVTSLQKLREALPCADFTIIYYQRNLLPLLYSWWQELIKHGSSDHFPSFLLNTILNPSSLHLLVSDFMLNNWAHVFGRDAIKIFLYDKITDVARQFASDVLEIDLVTKEQTKSNRSYDYLECEMMRLWNIRGFSGSDILQTPSIHVVRAKVAERSNRFLENLSLNYHRSEFAAIEDLLISRWGDRIEGFYGGQLFADREISFSYMSANFWSANPDLVAAMCEFAERTKQKEFDLMPSLTNPPHNSLRETGMDTWNQLEIILCAARQREQLLEARLDKQTEQTRALEIVISALIASMRWRGLDRSKFKMLMTEIAQSTPSVGKVAARHDMYLYQSQRVLGPR